MAFVIAIDPGWHKCGLLLADLDSNLVQEAKVVHKNHVTDQVRTWISSNTIEYILLGNGTSSGYWEGELSSFASVYLVEEKGTTLRARYRYWELSPPSKWLRWIPKGLLFPPKNLDKVAALLLLEDYLNKKFQWRIHH